MSSTYNDPPWIPESNPTNIKYLGKFGEELGECSAAVSRCIIQGIDAHEPVTGKLNGTWLTEEIADVLANMQLVSNRFGLDKEYIKTRAKQKMDKLLLWHNNIPDAQR